jgi:urea carboxylase
MTVEVVKPGLSSTFQDLGRVGYQQIGVPVAGAMDELSHCIANLLVGNDASEATLEITLLGPTLRFRRAAVIALGGADLDASVGGDPLPLHTPHLVAADAVLAFGRRRSGLRGYLAVAGGFALPEVLGSRSTHVRSAMGGWQGRALRKGDEIPLRVVPTGAPRPLGPGAAALAARLASTPRDAAIRASLGREWSRFDAASQAAFFAAPYRIGAQSERMGYRLEGAVLRRNDGRDILSEAVAFGTVQVPAEGLPIVLMADRQSTGGYARIAQVASIDLPRLAQVMPGESVRFERIEVDAAQRLAVERAGMLAELHRLMT